MSEKTVPLGEVQPGHLVKTLASATCAVRGWTRFSKIAMTWLDDGGLTWMAPDEGCTDLGPVHVGPSEADELVEEFGGCTRIRDLMEACRAWAKNGNDTQTVYLLGRIRKCCPPARQGGCPGGARAGESLGRPEGQLGLCEEEK